ncbi:MAG TPA: hypothetical protein VKU36_01850, partial [Candidatus Babeliales bacterium]|nr:hypothetical protein [Candidatus Babeliales bacterium]
MKKTLQSIALLSALYGVSLHASFEFRSPLSFEVDARGYQHWLLAPSDQAWWYGDLPSQKTNTDWNIHMWGMAYSRSANKAFFDKCSPCDTGKVTRHTGSLASLFFGAPVFRGEQAFPGGTFAGNQNNAQVAAGQVLVNAVNPYLAFARIAPVIEYQENGANMGFDAAKYLGANDRYHVGVRAYMPFRVIEVEPDLDASSEETLDNVFVTRIIDTNAGAPGQVEYAMRFDFLSTLVFNQTAMPSGATMARPVVVYTNDTMGNAIVMLAGQDLTGTSPAQNTTTIPAAYATKSCDGTVPAIPF